MKVILLDHTENPVNKIAYCARICYSTRRPEELKEKLSVKEANRMVKMIIESGHHSILEHINFTFGVTGISRNASHQIVRHRMSSFAQQSLRYSELTDTLSDAYSMTEEYNIPEYIKTSPELSRVYIDELEKMEKLSLESYHRLLENDIRPEDARNVLLTSINSNMIITMNGRALFNFFNLRLCFKAQSEIRKIASEMFIILNKKYPEIFQMKYCGPNCYVSGKECKEIQPCLKI